VDDFNSLQLATFYFDGIKAGDTAGEFGAIQIADTNDVTGCKIAFASCDAGRQQAFAVFAQGFARSVIHDQRALGVMKERNPAFTSLQSAGLRHEQGALLFASEERLVPDWIHHIDFWILAANAQVAADEAAEEKRKAETQARDHREALLKQVNDKFKNL